MNVIAPFFFLFSMLAIHLTRLIKLLRVKNMNIYHHFRVEKFTCFNQLLWIRNKSKNKRLCKMDQFMIYYMLQQPRPVGVLLFFSDRGQREATLLWLPLQITPREGHWPDMQMKFKRMVVFSLNYFCQNNLFYTKSNTHGFPLTLPGSKLCASKQVGFSSTRPWKKEFRSDIFHTDYMGISRHKTSSIHDKQCRN